MATLTGASIIAPDPSYSAERSVREVASRLGIPNVEHVIQQMKQEYVVTDWQLSALDSFQWKSLGAPIGLAVAVHLIIQQQQQRRRQVPYDLPADNKRETTEVSEIYRDLDQHNNIMESTILDIQHKSIECQEKEESIDAEENNYTVVSAAIQETSIELGQDEECLESESIVTDASEPDATSKNQEEDSDDKTSIPYSNPDEANVVAETIGQIFPPKEATSSMETPPPLPQQPKGCNDGANTPDADNDTNTETSSRLENNNGDKALAQPDTANCLGIQDEEQITRSDNNRPLKELVAEEYSKPDDASNNNGDSLLSESVANGATESPVNGNNPLEELAEEESRPDAASNDDNDDGSLGLPNDITHDAYDAKPPQGPLGSTTISVEESLSEKIVDKTSSEDDAETSEATNEGDIMPTTSMSEEEESSRSLEHQYKPSSLTTTHLSAPLPHEECDDSFHVSEGKELLLLSNTTPSFDYSEDMSEDHASNEEITDEVVEKEEEASKEERLELPRFIHEENDSQYIDYAGGKDEEENKEKELLDQRDEEENNDEKTTVSIENFNFQQHKKEEQLFVKPHRLIQEEDDSKDIDSFDDDDDDDDNNECDNGEMNDDEEESLDTEDDIFISGEDLLVDLSGDDSAAQGDAPDDNHMQEKRFAANEDPFEISYGQFRATPLVDPNSVTITEFRTTASEDLDDDEERTTSMPTKNKDPSLLLSEPFVMHKRTVSSLESLYYIDNDECTVVASNVSPERRNRPKRRRSLEDSTEHHSIHSTLSHVSMLFDVEWDQLCIVLQDVPSTRTQRTILSQLLIMTNGRTKAARYKMGKQISQMILKSLESKTTNDDVDTAADSSDHRKGLSSQLRSNLQLFAKLHREERKALGKKIFGQISRLYAGGDDGESNRASKDEKKKSPSNQKEAPTIR